MKLTDLDPTWIVRLDRIVGVRFTCPMPNHEHQVAVLFSNPPDAGPPHPSCPSCPGDNNGMRWNRGGDTFYDLSLSPSINCTKFDPSCWHGFVTAGEVF